MFKFLKKKQRLILDVEKLKEALDYLNTNPKISWDPYPSYDGRIFTVLKSLGIDEMYMQNSEKLENVPIETMSLENLKTMYTFILRGERFCEGTIASYVEDGSLAKMVKREIELSGGNA